MNENTRLTLLEKIRDRHDEQSWEEFVDTYRPFVYSVCRQMKLNHHDSEELTQDVLLKLWDKLPEFQYSQNGRFRGWLCTITGNVVKNFFRSHQRRTERQQKYCENDADFMPEIEKIAEKNWKKYAVVRAMENIRPLFPDLVIQTFELLNEGKRRPEVAEALGIPANRVSIYKERVLRRLTSEIRRIDQEWG
jgi:RNA polymerase sigma factor (sigma-70 family)